MLVLDALGRVVMFLSWLSLVVVVVYRGCDCLSSLWLYLEAGVIPRRRGCLLRLSLAIRSLNLLVGSLQP